MWNVRYRLLEGGAESGFRHVVAEKYTPRLFHFHGTGKNVVAKQVYGKIYVPCVELLAPRLGHDVVY